MLEAISFFVSIQVRAEEEELMLLLKKSPLKTMAFVDDQKSNFVFSLLQLYLTRDSLSKEYGPIL